jgi:hypothetical protein
MGMSGKRTSRTPEGPSQQTRTKGEHGSYVAVKGTDAGYVVRELKMATTVSAALVGDEAENAATETVQSITGNDVIPTGEESDRPIRTQ